jgi:hypothetical protein
MNNPIRIWLIAGRAQSGKDTTAIIMNEILHTYKHETNITHFADKLKILSYKLLKEFYPELTDTAFHNDKDKYNEFLKTSNRTFLQYLGTYARHVLGENVWIDSVEIHPGINIIADHRFSNEKLALEKLYPEADIKTIRIYRDYVDNTLITHESENVNFDCDFHIYNNSDMETLRINVKETVSRLLDSDIN